MTIEKQHNGSLLISDIVGHQGVKQVYYGYSQREARRRFRQFVRSLTKATVSVALGIVLVLASIFAFWAQPACAYGDCSQSWGQGGKICTTCCSPYGSCQTWCN